MENTCALHDCFCAQFAQTPLKVLECYSGIGGVHYALDRLPIKTKVTALDVNTNANEVLKFNFPNEIVLQRNILGLTSQEVDKMSVDLITMSPPCQPFTRQGLQKDLEDNRSNSFVHILSNVLPNMQRLPRFIMIENVKGFETSDARQYLVETLTSLDYDFRELLLSPSQLNIPNSRLRYYCIAKLRTTSDKDKPLFAFNGDKSIHEDIPEINPTCLKCRQLFFPDASRDSPFKPDFPSVTLKDCLTFSDPLLPDFELPDTILEKYSFILDIVDENSSSTCCFTRGYGNLIQGSGSVFKGDSNIETKSFFDTLPRYIEGEDETVSRHRIEQLKSLKLRYFTPKEIANLMSFPQQFDFPLHFTRRQKYKLLGNSVNVDVISLVLKLLFV